MKKDFYPRPTSRSVYDLVSTKKFLSKGIGVLFALFLFQAPQLRAQVIDESFEEDQWTDARTEPANSGSTKGSAILTKSTALTTLTYWSGYNQSSATASSVNTNANAGTWLYSKASAATSTYTKFSKCRSFDHWFGLSSGGYVATPVISGGVATVTFWVNVTTNFAVGLYTNTADNAHPGHSSNTLNTIPTAYTYASQVFLESDLITRSIVTNSTGGTNTAGAAAQLVSFTGSFSGPCRIGIFNLESSGLGIDDIVITSPAPMPVDFTQVKAVKKNNGIQVEWNVGAEQHVWKYEVERSPNGTAFDKMGEVIANNSKAYSWFDASPESGINYYRIKVLDKDNSVKYSSVVNVKPGTPKGDVFVYPNPVTGKELNVQLSNMERGEYTLRVFNAAGQVITNVVVRHQGGSVNQHVSLPAATKTGVYYLHIVGKEATFQHKLLVE